MAVKVLIVEDDRGSRTGLVQLLERAGYEVISGATFEEGRRLLATENPDLLITDVRLEEFNGLQLIITRRPPVPAIVVTGYADPVLEQEAKRLGADYLIKPFLPSALLRLVERKVSTLPPVTFETARRWVRKPVAGGLLAHVETARARILDVSYGGLRFELDENPASALPSSFDVTLPTTDVAVHVDLVWQSRTHDGSWLCGAALSQTDLSSAKAWHGLVDALA
jgi:DNA-binding response OmpR family regulator